MRKSKGKKTKTSSFGTSGRFSHDSSIFYDSNLYKEDRKEVEYYENSIDDEYMNMVFCASSENMKELPDCSVHLMVTSPPYNASKEYDENLDLDEYLSLLNNVWKETYRVLVPGGRACVNIANLGRKPYIPLNSYITKAMIDIGFLMRGEVIWNKGSSAGASTAWGSWQSASNPVLRDLHEYILIFSKCNYGRKKLDKENTIQRDEFLEYTKSIWNFQSESARKIGHPAPFPEELPSRLIKLYSFKDDVILDPFVGSGTTCLSALKNERNYIGYDKDQNYVDLANKRIDEYKKSSRFIQSSLGLEVMTVHNQTIRDIFSNGEEIELIKKILPDLFHTAHLEMSRGGKTNPAVGLLREHAFCALLTHMVGEENVDGDLKENESESDVIIFDEEISIKTASFTGQALPEFKMCWTSNREAAIEYIRTWTPNFPIIYVAINWGTTQGGIYYIPIEAVKDAFDSVGRDDFFKLLGGNPRGVPVTKEGLNAMIDHTGTIHITMDWNSQNPQYNAGNASSRWLSIIKDLDI